MGLAIFKATGNQGWINKRHASYATAHDAASGDNKSSPTIIVRNSLDSYDSKYEIHRGFVDFISDLIGNDDITGARLVLCLSSKGQSDAGYVDLYIVEGEQNIPLVYSDYGAHLSKTTSGGYMPYAGITTGVYTPTIITLNDTGLGWINPSGLTKFCLRLISDINSLTPTGEPNGVAIYGSGAWTGVVTKAATLIDKQFATLNGTSRGGSTSPPFLEITYVGDSLEYPRVRFNYGVYPDYSNNTSWQSGVPCFTDFSEGLIGLAPNTLYRFRTELQDAQGTIYGSLLTFRTLVDPPIVTTDPVSNILESEATLKGTLVNDKGLACLCNFQWGETESYGYTTATQSKTTGQTFSQVVDAPGVSWDPEITYHVRAKATNDYGTGYGIDRTFIWTEEEEGTSEYTTPDIYDWKGRVAKGARIQAYRTDTHALVATETINQYGNATFTELPNDVDIRFIVNWGGTAQDHKSRTFTRRVEQVTDGGTGYSTAENARSNLGIGATISIWNLILGD